MHSQKTRRFGRSLCTPGGMIVILFLCVSVIMQMLGAPVTLLNPAETSDVLAASVLEGFSVPPALLHLTPSSEAVLVTDAQPSVYVLVLASAPFHPPVP